MKMKIKVKVLLILTLTCTSCVTVRTPSVNDAVLPNMLSTVGPFAVDEGLVKAKARST